MVISDEKKQGEVDDNGFATPQMMMGNIGATDGYRPTQDFDLMRLNTGKSEFFAEEFENMLGSGMGMQASGLPESKPEYRK